MHSIKALDSPVPASSNCKQKWKNHLRNPDSYQYSQSLQDTERAAYNMLQHKQQEIAVAWGSKESTGYLVSSHLKKKKKVKHTGLISTDFWLS